MEETLILVIVGIVSFMASVGLFTILYLLMDKIMGDE